MSYAALSNDALAAHREYQAKTGRFAGGENFPDTSPLENLRDVVRDIDQGQRGNLYAEVLKTLGPMLSEARALPGANIFEAREKMSNLFTSIIRGGSRVERQVILRWLVEHHRAEFDQFAKRNRINVPEQLDDTPLYSAFLCWSGDYAREICEEIRDLFEYGDERVSVFLSSQDIQAGHRWRETIEKSLAASASGLLIATQDIVNSDWIPHEFGVLATKAQPPQILLLDAPAALLPKPLVDYQHQAFTTERLVAWVKRIFNEAGADLFPNEVLEFEAKIDATIARHRQRYVTGDNARWADKFARATIMSKQHNSPFDLEQVLSTARKHLVLVAQNHWFMTKHEGGGSARFWPQVESALRRGVQIDIVGMHPRVGPSGFSAEDTANANEVWRHFMGSPDFYKHVRETWDAFAEWVGWYADLKEAHPEVAKLGIYGAYFTPLTVSLVDPEREDAYLVLSPRINSESSPTRPQIILERKAQPIAFDYYSDSIINGFANAGWRELPIEKMVLNDAFEATGTLEGPESKEIQGLSAEMEEGE